MILQPANANSALNRANQGKGGDGWAILLNSPSRGHDNVAPRTPTQLVCWISPCLVAPSLHRLRNRITCAPCHVPDAHHTPKTRRKRSHTEVSP